MVGGDWRYFGQFSPSPRSLCANGTDGLVALCLWRILGIADPHHSRWQGSYAHAAIGHGVLEHRNDRYGLLASAIGSFYWTSETEFVPNLFYLSGTGIAIDLLAKFYP